MSGESRDVSRGSGDLSRDVSRGSGDLSRGPIVLFDSREEVNSSRDLLIGLFISGSVPISVECEGMAGSVVEGSVSGVGVLSGRVLFGAAPGIEFLRYRVSFYFPQLFYY